MSKVIIVPAKTIEMPEERWQVISRNYNDKTKNAEAIVELIDEEGNSKGLTQIVNIEYVADKENVDSKIAMVKEATVVEKEMVRANSEDVSAKLATEI